MDSDRWDYLSALNRPRLPMERRLALTFMDHVRQTEEMHGLLGVPDAQEPAPGVRCLSCGKKLKTGNLYCGPFCEEGVAKFVRYVRACQADGRIRRADIQEAVSERLLMIHNGKGYPDRDRKLEPAIRLAIMVRDGGTCQECGKPATEIDHIEGSSSDPSNLQALCGACNRKRSFDRARFANTRERAFIERLWDGLAERIAAPSPLRVCDDSDHWRRRWPTFKAAARRAHPAAADAVDTEIVELMALGLTFAEIAGEIGLHRATVTRRVQRIRARAR